MAPDRRHFFSLAEGLLDRQAPDGIGPNFPAEARDLLERISETVGAMNVDYLNARTHDILTPSYAYAAGVPFSPSAPGPLPPSPGDQEDDVLPLTTRARKFHRRLACRDAFETVLLMNPGELEKRLRPPDDTSPIFDGRMPPAMRGPTGKPLSLTRRQYQLLLKYGRSITQ
jgi:hypothetical protein